MFGLFEQSLSLLLACSSLGVSFPLLPYLSCCFYRICAFLTFLYAPVIVMTCCALEPCLSLLPKRLGCALRADCFAPSRTFALVAFLLLVFLPDAQASKAPFPAKGITLAELPRFMSSLLAWAHEVQPPRALPNVVAGFVSHLSTMDDRITAAWMAYETAARAAGNDPYAIAWADFRYLLANAICTSSDVQNAIIAFMALKCATTTDIPAFIIRFCASMNQLNMLNVAIPDGLLLVNFFIVMIFYPDVRFWRHQILARKKEPCGRCSFAPSHTHTCNLTNCLCGPWTSVFSLGAPSAHQPYFVFSVSV